MQAKSALGAIVAVGAVSALAFTVPTDSTARQPCEASLTPDSISAQAEPVAIAYAFSVPIGEVSNVTFDEESGLALADLDAEKMTVNVAAADARPGEWNVTFHGPPEIQDAICLGELTVQLGN
jgi:hypothetical protein